MKTDAKLIANFRRSLTGFRTALAKLHAIQCPERRQKARSLLETLAHNLATTHTELAIGGIRTEG